MTIADQLELELNQLAAGGFAAPHALQLAVPGGHIRCDLESLDSIGCSLAQIQWAPLKPHTPAELKAIADWLCGQVQYLLEPLAVIETDPDGAHLQIRSYPPTQLPQATSYYEALVSSSGITLRRYSAPPGTPRQAIPMQVTRETLARLVTDLADSAQHATPSTRPGKRP
jgi:hypothetical protein